MGGSKKEGLDVGIGRTGGGYCYARGIFAFCSTTESILTLLCADAPPRITRRPSSPSNTRRPPSPLRPLRPFPIPRHHKIIPRPPRTFLPPNFFDLVSNIFHLRHPNPKHRRIVSHPISRARTMEGRWWRRRRCVRVGMLVVGSWTWDGGVGRCEECREGGGGEGGGGVG